MFESIRKQRLGLLHCTERSSSSSSSRNSLFDSSVPRAAHQGGLWTATDEQPCSSVNLDSHSHSHSHAWSRMSSLPSDRSGQLPHTDHAEVLEEHKSPLSAFASAQSVPRILVVNPNSSLEMTLGMRQRLGHLQHHGKISRQVRLAFVTANENSGVPASIDNFTHEIASAHLVHQQVSKGPFKALQQEHGGAAEQLLEYQSHDIYPSGYTTGGDAGSFAGINVSRCQAVLVACFSNHPLAQMLRTSHPHLKVLHILEAAVLAALSAGGKFGILTTVQGMVDDIDEGVASVIGRSHPRFVGTLAAGVNAAGLEDGNRKQDVDALVSRAASELVAKGAKAIILGCAAMGDRATLIRQVCHANNATVTIIDGTVAGVQLLTNLLLSE